MLAQALGHAGRAASRYRDARESVTCFDEALSLLRPHGPTKLLGLMLLSQATAHKHAGEVALAQSYALEGQAVAAKLGDVQTRDMCGIQLASIAFEADELADATAIARENLEKCRRAPFMRNHFVAAQWLAGFLLLDGDVEEGRAAALEAFPLSRALGNVNLMDSDRSARPELQQSRETLLLLLAFAVSLRRMGIATPSAAIGSAWPSGRN